MAARSPRPPTLPSKLPTPALHACKSFISWPGTASAKSSKRPWSRAASSKKSAEPNLQRSGGCRAAAPLAETPVAYPGLRGRALRAAVALTSRVETLRDFTGRAEGRRAEGEREERIFVFGGPKPKIFPPKDTSRRADPLPRAVGGSATPNH